VSVGLGSVVGHSADSGPVGSSQLSVVRERRRSSANRRNVYALLRPTAHDRPGGQLALTTLQESSGFETSISIPYAPPLTTSSNNGILLEDLTWRQAEEVLRPATVVVIPIGAACKEHGPHLKLKNDWLLAEYFKREILKNADVVVAPTVNYHYYPAFVEYPGSISLRLETARDLVVDICRSLSRYGPRKFYGLNTGVSTMRPLALSADLLAAEGIEFRYTDILKLTEQAERNVKQEEGGTHANEIETSMMLFIAPETVEMSAAVKDYHPSTIGGLTRSSSGEGSYSASGIYGDPTLATPRKGEIVVGTIIQWILQEIEELREGR
jgi:creatinine amidohydrolase